MSFWLWVAIAVEVVGTFTGGVTAMWYWLDEAEVAFDAYVSGLFWAVWWPIWLMFFTALILNEDVGIEHRDVRKAKRQAQLAEIAAEEAEADARRDKALGL